ncbi:MAG TPA: hypothetical protein VGG41_06610 [Solirubrobacteraceae bacterium]
MRGASAAAALAAAALLAGCGGSGHPAPTSSSSSSASSTSTSGSGSGASSSSGSASSGPTGTKAAFVARADAICKASQTALGPVLKRETATLDAKPPKRAAAATALQQASAIVASGLKQLKALPQPGGGASLLATVYRALGEEAGTLHKLSGDVRAGRSKAMSTDASEQTAFSTLYTGAAQKFGFKRCGASASS